MKTMKKQILFACLIAFVLLILSGALLIRLSVSASAEREAKYGEAMMDSIEELVTILRSGERERSSTLLKENNERIVHFMARSLREFVDGETYTGPRVIGEGVVVELRGDRVIYPDEMEPGYVRLSDEEIERMRSLTPDDLFLGFMTEKEERSEENWNGERLDEASEEKAVILASLFGENIAGPFYYVERTTGDELYEYIDTRVGYSDSLQTAEQAYGGAILDIDRDDLQLNNESFFFPGVKDAAELGITRESIDARRPTVDIKGTRYLCTYGNGGPSSVLIYLHPYDQLVGQSTGEALLVSAVMFLLLVEIVCYLTSVMDYVSKADPFEPQRLQKYLPKTLKRRMLAGGALGIVIVFLLASMICSLGILYNETVESRTTARTLIRELRENESRRQENVTELEEEWYLYYAGQLAHLISEYPAFGSREKLRDFADSVSADYVMLFDADGNEKACSHDYYKYTLGAEEGSELHAFRCLLKGIPSVRADAGQDGITETPRRLIGVTVPDRGGNPGALLLSVSPQRLGRTDGASDPGEQLPLLTAEGTLCLVADQDGTIIEASEPRYIGNTVMQYGLPENSLRDGYMSFLALENVRCYAVTVKENEEIYFFFNEVSSLFGSVVRYALLAAAAYAVIFLLLLTGLLHGYGERVFTPQLRSAVENALDRAPRISSTHERQYSQRPFSGHWNSLFLNWKQLMPEERAGGVFCLCLCVLILSCLLMELLDERLSLFAFILKGDWMRGFNLFSLCAVLIILLLAFLANYLLRQILLLVTLFQSGRAETICRLVYSFAGYFLAFVSIYCSFTYLGFPTSAVLASVGLATLALTLGVQGMVADIVAGVAIVFEGAFQVGDIVEVEGYWGRVEEIGIRTTKLINRTNDVKIIENSQIKNLVNKTKYYTVCIVRITVSAEESLVRIEEILAENLPLIGKKYPGFLSEPQYRGVS